MHYPILTPTPQPTGLTVTETAQVMRISRKRVYQLEARALDKLRRMLLADKTDVDLERNYS